MVLVIGHRGARQHAVENSLTSLKIAIDQGADGVELDLQLSADGELFLFHDEDLARLTGDRRRTCALPWRELRALRQRDGRHGPSPIAHIDELLEWCADLAVEVNFELKVDQQGRRHNGLQLADAFARRVQGLQHHHWLVSSFHRQTLNHLGEALPTIRRAALVDDDRRCAWWRLLEADDSSSIAAEVGQVHPHGGLLTAQRLAVWRRRGWPVWVWTLNDPHHWEQAVTLGEPGDVAAIITDNPEGLRRYVDRNGLASMSVQPPGIATEETASGALARGPLP